MTAPAPRDAFVSVADGLKLHLRDWRPENPRGAPVLCLPGLARTLDDFVSLAEHLSSGGRRVIALSARGRGLSDRDSDPARYQLKIESEDALAVLEQLGIAGAHVIGTSRGGLQAMMIGALRPDVLRSVVLNDSGPIVENEGLKRIRDALSDQPIPLDYPEAARQIAARNAQRFPALSEADYDRWARRAWRETDDGLVSTCDSALQKIFDGIDLDAPSAPIWPLFDALAKVPLMVVRGEFSDILSESTVSEIVARRPATLWTTPGQGHAPLLDDGPTMAAIAEFLDAVDG